MCPVCGYILEITEDEAMGQTKNCPHCGYTENIAY